MKTPPAATPTVKEADDADDERRAREKDLTKKEVLAEYAEAYACLDDLQALRDRIVKVRGQRDQMTEEQQKAFRDTVVDEVAAVKARNTFREAPKVPVSFAEDKIKAMAVNVFEVEDRRFQQLTLRASDYISRGREELDRKRQYYLKRKSRRR